jgi:hypothetical protein
MMEIDIDELIAEAVKHMEDDTDVRWSVGMAMQVLYWGNGWEDVQKRMVKLYNEERCDDNHNRT